MSTAALTTLPREHLAPGAATCARTVTSFDASALDADAWDRLAIRTGCGVQMSFDWCRTWWHFYAGRRALRILVLRDARGDLAALLPLFVDRVWLGPVPLRIARLVGSDFGLGLFDPPLPAEHAAALAAAAVEVLLTSGDADALVLGPLMGNRPLAAALRAALANGDRECQLMPTMPRGPHSIFEFPATFDAYTQALPKTQRGNFRRDLNLIRRERGLDVDVLVDPGALDAEFDRFAAMHARQWRAEGKLGHFDDWPRSRAFHAAVLRVSAQQRRARLVRLMAGGDVAAYQYCYRFGDAWCWLLPAREPGEAWRRYGLGRLGLLTMVELAIGEGARWMDGGPGHYDYKVQHGAIEYPMQTILAVPKCGSAKLQTRMFARLADWLHLAYYRGWFGRIAPRVPLPRGPLWSTWIRSRL